MSKIQGKISQVIGPVVDVTFDKGMSLPNIYDALEVFKTDGTIDRYEKLQPSRPEVDE